VSGEVGRQLQLTLVALDAVSQHMLIGVQHKLEHQLWMLRSQLAD
jgi:DNA-binding ferritin-like protein